MESTELVKSICGYDLSRADQFAACQKTADDMRLTCAAIAVNDARQAENAGLVRMAVKAATGWVEEQFAAPVANAHALHKELVAKRDSLLRPLNQGADSIKRTIEAWDRAERIKRQAEADRRAAELRKQDEERRLHEAIAAEQSGQAALADVILNEPPTPVVAVAEPVARAPGVTFREAWKFRIVDVAQIPRDYLVPDEVKIGQVVRAMKAATVIPGVEVYSERV